MKKEIKIDIKEWILTLTFISVVSAFLFAPFIERANQFVDSKNNPVVTKMSDKQQTSIEKQLADFIGMDEEEVNRKMTKPVERAEGTTTVDVLTTQGLYRMSFDMESDSPIMVEAIRL